MGKGVVWDAGISEGDRKISVRSLLGREVGDVSFIVGEQVKQLSVSQDYQDPPCCSGVALRESQCRIPRILDSEYMARRGACRAANDGKPVASISRGPNPLPLANLHTELSLVPSGRCFSSSLL